MENKENEEIIAIISEDKGNGLVTISSVNSWGPIIVETTMEAAKLEFEKALEICIAVRNFNIFRTSMDHFKVARSVESISMTHIFEDKTTTNQFSSKPRYTVAVPC